LRTSLAVIVSDRLAHSRTRIRARQSRAISFEPQLSRTVAARTPLRNIKRGLIERVGDCVVSAVDIL